ncbi:aldo/keto reductase [Spirochaeta thermophila DSM 6578]|uniref:Aldo/keto reductase n=2 Tax=Winmispira thermophila TaxID=154 RepID=G0GBI7_WINT7|nr:aldo/keto reductase [Spirochaeta thermophila DSM 6578]
MYYRTMGRTGVEVSALGFGCMRFPTKGGDSSRIDEAQAERMLLYAIEHGVNYLDTAWPYHGGRSEPFVGNVLERHGLRDRVFLATKMPMWEVKTGADLDRIFDEQRRRLRTDYVDFYLLHSLNKENWKRVEASGALEWLQRKKEEGAIRFIGFSFHDEISEFKRYVDALGEGWDFCQIQYNYMNEHEQAGTEGLNYAAERGLGVVVMEPLLGGYLAGRIPRLEPVWAQSGRSWSPVEWALRWLWNNPKISLVLSGMSTLEQVEENVRIASTEGGAPGNLSSGDLEVIVRVREVLESSKVIPCTSCNYCQPCPHDVEIPRIFKIYNDAEIFGNVGNARGAYRWIPEGHRASDCVACGECETKCPQQIEIIDWLKKAGELLEV